MVEERMWCGMAVKANWVGMVQMCGGGRTGAAMGSERESVCMLGEESEKERQRRDRGGPQRGYGFQKTHE